MSNRSEKHNRAIIDFDDSQRQHDSIQQLPGPSGRSLRSQKQQHASVNDSELTINSENVNGTTNSTETEVLISNCVRFILLNEYTKTIIKQSDINKYLSENYSLKRYEINELMKKVSNRLLNDFGFRLVEIIDTSSKSYILYTLYKNNLFSLDESEDDEEDGDEDGPFDESLIPLNYDEDIPPNVDEIHLGDLTYDQLLDTSKRTLLIISLSLIFLEETQQLLEKDLFISLENIGLDLNSKYENGHDLPKQNIKELISKEFVRKGYFKRTKKPNSDIPASAEYIYEWGIRAQIEFKTTDILQFIQEIYEYSDTYFIQLQKKAEKADKNRELFIFGSKTINNNCVVENNTNGLEQNNNDDVMEEILEVTATRRITRSSQQRTLTKSRNQLITSTPTASSITRSTHKHRKQRVTIQEENDEEYQQDNNDEGMNESSRDNQSSGGQNARNTSGYQGRSRKQQTTGKKRNR